MDAHREQRDDATEPGLNVGRAKQREQRGLQKPNAQLEHAEPVVARAERSELGRERERDGAHLAGVLLGVRLDQAAGAVALDSHGGRDPVDLRAVQVEGEEEQRRYAGLSQRTRV